ncbi:MAG TPA: dihydrolipoamide acetyltransferase family protein [Steroidobacteraceae bacterium]|jgi:2-oxoisovalerate dehydrogenase E2 component (dihydrolipoyl transacylase)|nr:dihydrolipoamide acetyltransferase family protein [Steroidobacteraceae bacterium]
MGTFRLPDLGEGLAEAEILAWHVKPGDQVLADQPMISVETAKSVVEVPVPYAGTIMKLHGSVGDIVATGAPLIDFDSGTVVGSMPVATETELVESAVAAVSRGNGAARPRALPVARAAARHLGLDLAGIRGNGHGGAITLDDVLAHANPAGSPGAADGTPDHAVPPPELPPGAAWEPLRGLRRAMARSMSASQAEVPLATVCDDADVHGWSKPGDYMLRLVRALIGAWRIEPALNAWYDAASNARVLFDHIDLAIAVDTPQGLIVPVVRHIENKTPEELKAAVAAQKSAAHQRSIPPEDLRGFTLMLSNFGTLAGRYGIPIVVPPAVAILGAGKVRTDAVAVGGTVAAHRRMPLSLSFDHRCITGGEACRFLAAVIADLEIPD